MCTNTIAVKSRYTICGMDSEKIGPFCPCLYRIQCLLSFLKFDSSGLKDNWRDNTLGTDGGIVIRGNVNSGGGEIPLGGFESFGG